METGEPLSTVRDRVLSANAYIGSVPIVEALSRGANVVITGRSTDTALTMAPLRFEFGWGATDWNRLAAGIIAGHIIECGAQCSGGNCLYDWRDIPDLADVGYPIVEGHRPTARFVVTKHPEHRRTRSTCPRSSEQLVYEMGDPHSYITPDVVADFSSIHLEQAGRESRARVRHHGARRPPTSSRSPSPTATGYKAVGSLVYAWPDALEKAQLADRVLRERLDRLGLTFDHVLTEFVGASATHGRLAGDAGRDAPEVQFRIGVRARTIARRSSDSRARSSRWCSTARRASRGSPAGRPKVEEIVAYWPALIDKSVVQTHVEML